LLEAGLLWEKSTAGWWLISQANRATCVIEQVARWLLSALEVLESIPKLHSVLNIFSLVDNWALSLLTVTKYARWSMLRCGCQAEPFGSDSVWLVIWLDSTHRIFSRWQLDP
jgi:hypothetical protein